MTSGLERADGGGRKLVVVGASSHFAPALLRELGGNVTLRGGELWFVDTEEETVEGVVGLARAICRGEGIDVRVEGTTARREALPGADFVVMAVAVGGLDAWEADIELPARYGIFMEIGDTVGPGGMLRAFRHVPVVAAVCEDVREMAPGARVFNYTNPLMVNTLAMLATSGIRGVSLCTCVADLNRRVLSDLAGTDPDELSLPPVVGGINHFAAVIALRLKDGGDALELIRGRLDGGALASISDEDMDIGTYRHLVDTYEVFPYCADHWMEFHPELLRTAAPYEGRAQGLALKHGVRVRDMAEQQERVAGWRAILERAQGPSEVVRSDGARVMTVADLPPEDPDKPVEVLRLIDAIEQDGKQVFIVNTANRGAIENLPSDAVVEVAALAGAYGIRPLSVGRLPEAFAAKLRRYIALGEVVRDAALSGRRDLAFRAFMLDPVVAASLEPGEAHELLGLMLDTEAEYLPRFRP